MSTLIQDLRYSLRVLAGRPAFSAIAVVVLALGIGANSAIFTLVSQLLLRPLAAEQAPGTLVGLYSQDRVRPDNYRAFSYPNYVDIRDGNDVFEHLLAEGIGLVGITEGDSTHRAMAFVVSSNYFATLGGHLAVGRTFTAGEERPGSRSMVVIVSYPFWQAHGGGADFLGHTVKVNGRDYTVVGITSKGFTGALALLAPEIYAPLGVQELIVNDLFRDDQAHTRLDDRQNHSLVLIGRLKPGLTEEAVGPRLDVLARRLAQAYPDANKDQALVVHRLRRLGISTSPGDDSDVSTVFIALQTMAGLVLLIACINLANMMLARASARRKEMGIRLALGAGRGRIIRQLLLEGLVLSLAGGAAGLLVAYWAMSLLVSSLVGVLPVSIDFAPTPDARVVAATLAFAIASTVMFALWPAIRLAHTDVVPELKQQTGDYAQGGRRWLSLRHALVVAQIALSLGLLTAGGLFLHSAIGAAGAEPGFPFRDGLVASIDPALAGYDEARGRQVYRELLDRVRALPGVRAASVASLIPYGEVNNGGRLRRPGTTGDEGRASATHNVVGSEYFASLGLAVLRGREFTAAEESSAAGAPVAIIDEPLVARLFPGEDPLGKQIVFINDDETPRGQPMEIVGIVPGLRQDLYDRAPVAHVYTPFGANYTSWMNLHVKLTGGGREAEIAALEAVRRALHEVDEKVPVLSLKTLEGYRESNFSLWMARAGAKLFTTFGALALFLAVVGVYGVKAYLLALRTREIGIRMALGASPADVLGLVLRDGAVLAAAGVTLGLGLAALIATGVAGLIYQPNPYDPIVFASAVTVLFGAAMAATYVPARRAMKVQPTTALRTE